MRITVSSSGLRFAVVLAAVASAFELSAAGGEPRLVAAYFSQGQNVLNLFPLDLGKSSDVALPPLAPSDFLLSFGPDSKSIYFGSLASPASGITKIEFGPTRKSIVPGSAGLVITSLTGSLSGRIVVSASDQASHQCGAYEIDPVAGTHRPVRVGDDSNCGGAIGIISPDGKNLLSTHSLHRTPGSPPSIERLSLFSLETGATQSLGVGRGSWSPDGRWIAVSGSGRIVLIDANNLSHRKKLGASGVDDHLIWSPDSKRLLFVKQESRCRILHLFPVDEESIEVVDVETGKRQAIPSAHCAVYSSAIGWVDAEAVR